MNNKLKSILLVDDDAATNFLHKIMVSDAECADHVHVAINGKQALEYLNASIAGAQPKPDLIFLDINMPVMNGWEFLSEYEKLPAEYKQDTRLMMLTTSINPDDLERAQSNPEVTAFKNKTLTVEMLQDIVKDYFTPNQQ